MDWICAKGIIESGNLTKVISSESKQILTEIFLRFEKAYDDENEEEF